MQTILGSGGAIGKELAKALLTYTNEIRLVSRNPYKVNPDDQLFAADLTNPDQVNKAVQGSEIVYLTVGLPYDTAVWQTTWPVIMKNVISACQTHQAKLVFFDNIYMYDPDHMSFMTEETPVRPVSKKGQIREKIAQMLLNAVDSGDLQALIARSADFYGPSIKGASVLTETVFNNLYKGKGAIWLGPAKYLHSHTYTPDAGKATAILGNTPDAYNQVWHLPTAPDPLTGKEWVNTIAGALKVKPKLMEMPQFMLRIMGLFIPVMKETVEIMYQHDRDYVFDSSKFCKRFDFVPTPYLEGIKIIVQTDYQKQ